MSESVPNPYEPHVRAPDGRMVRISEINAYKEQLLQEANQKTKNDTGEPINRSRRNFLIGASALTAGVALKSIWSNTAEKEVNGTSQTGETTVSGKNVSEQKNLEQDPRLLTPLEQIVKFGEIKNLSSGINSVYIKHYEHLTDTPKGKRDMEMAVENIRKFDLKKFVEPFQKLGIPQQLAYMIAIQETRGRVVTSWAGARGVMGIMPATAKAFGRQPKKADNPLEASAISAQFLKEEQIRFNNNLDMVLHAYNGGGGLFGFTKSVSKEKRTPANFYSFMQVLMNTRYREVVKNRYFEHTVEKNDTPLQISKNYDASLRNIYALNSMNDSTVFKIGDKIKIPFGNTQEDIKKLFRKEFEVLQYAPEVRAKYEALKQHGLLEQLEASLPIKTDTFG